MPQFDIISFFDNSLVFFVLPVFFICLFFIIFFPEWISFCKFHKKFINLFSCSIWLVGFSYPFVYLRSSIILGGWANFFLNT